MASVPVYVSVAARTTFQAGTSLPTVTSTPTLFTDQGTLDAVALVAALQGITLFYSATGSPAPPVLTGSPVTSVDGVPGDTHGNVSLAGHYVPHLPTVGAYTYDGSGRIASDPDGNTYTYNSDNTIATVTKGGVTRTATYGANGIASWA